MSSRQLRVHLIRHGESTANQRRGLAGQLDVPLTLRGVRQALALREPLRALEGPTVLSSDLQRALDTARLALPGYRIERRPALRERSLGAWEGVPRADLAQPAALLCWHTPPPGGGESYAALQRRCLAVMADAEAACTTGDLVIVCHGGVIRVLLAAADELGPKAAARLRPANGEVHRRTLRPGGWGALLRRALG